MSQVQYFCSIALGDTSEPVFAFRWPGLIKYGDSAIINEGVRCAPLETPSHDNLAEWSKGVTALWASQL